MAQNWNVKQALAAINKGNKEAIADIGRRFPLTSNILARIGEDKAAGELINALPDHITVRKIESILKDGIQVDDSDNDVDVDDEVEEKSESKKQNSKNANNEYSSLNGTQLADLLKEHGVYADCKKKMGGAKRQQMLDYIEKYGLEAGEPDDADDENTEDNPYAGKTAMELFKECKKRGLKAKPKQKAAVYVDLLMKDDQSNAESDDTDDDWEDEEEEKPAKKETKKKASTKKTTKKEEPEDDDDDDDDWNI